MTDRGVAIQIQGPACFSFRAPACSPDFVHRGLAEINVARDHIKAHDLRRHGIYYYVPSLVKHFQSTEINELIVPRAHLSVNGRKGSVDSGGGRREDSGLFGFEFAGDARADSGTDSQLFGK